MRMNKWIWFAIVGALAMGAVVTTTAQSSLSSFDRAGEAPIVLGDEGPAPELVGIESWLNSPPRRLAEVRGQVVLLDFWTYGCVNCARTLPHVRRWQETYAAQGLVMIGVHSPEFAFEREPRNVAAAVRRFSITYPVALDTERETWRAFQIRYWPSIVLIDRTGNIVLRHAGEGDYDEIDRAIRAALGAEK